VQLGLQKTALSRGRTSRISERMTTTRGSKDQMVAESGMGLVSRASCIVGPNGDAQLYWEMKEGPSRSAIRC
jgi:hypothetical protein